MAEREPKDMTKRVNVVLSKAPNHEEQEQAAGQQSDSSLVDRVTCRAGDESCATAHASTLNRATSHHPSRAYHSLLQLQRQYGNRYVDRVLALGRQAADENMTDNGVTNEVETTLQQERGKGHKLDHTVRRQMEGAFGADFSGVQIHSDTPADSLSRALNARAFTTGQDIFFSRGAYEPGSSAGRELIAHELTHVVQQDGDKVRRAMTVSQPGDPHEVEAEKMARAVMESESSPATKEEPEEQESVAPPGTSRLQRQPEASKDDEEEKKKHGSVAKSDKSRPVMS